MDIKITELLINSNEIKFIARNDFCNSTSSRRVNSSQATTKRHIIYIVIGKIFRNGNGNNHIKKRD